MIDNLILKNIQSHENSTLNLSEGVNAIVGASDHGKSAVIRGLVWLLTNRPSGNSIISNWIKNDKDKLIDVGSVTITKGETTITRTKSKDENSYKINDKELPTVGMDVPEEVQNLLNISDVNVQGQHDGAFLLASSGSEVARFFNSVINLEQIDKSLTAIDKKKRDTNKEMKQTKDKIIELEEELQQFEHLDKLKDIINKLETKDTKIKASKGKIEDLQIINNNYKEQRIIILDTRKYLEAENMLKEIEVLKESIDKANEKRRKLKDVKFEYLDSKEIIEKYEDYGKADKYIERAEITYTDLSAAKVKLRSIKNSYNEYKESKETIDNDKLSTIDIDDIVSRETILTKKKVKLKAFKMFKYDHDSAQQDVVSLEERVKGLLEEMPEVCPTCGQTLKGVTL